MNSKLKPSHLAGGVAVLVVLIPIVALTQIDLGRDPGPVIRIKLSDPQPYVPEEAMVSPVNGSVEAGDNAIEGASVAGRSSDSAAPASRAEPRAAPRRSSSPRPSGVVDQAPRSELPRPESTAASEGREPGAVPRMVSPVRVAPRPRPPEVVRRVDASPAVTPVSSAQRPAEDVQDEEQASGEDVSPTEAAREALRDVRPR